MSGLPNHNFDAFDRAEYELTDHGYEVFNPASSPAPAGGHDEARYDHYLALDLPAVCRADIIMLLRGWEKSRGARLELATAELCGKQVALYRPDPNDPGLLTTEVSYEELRQPLFSGWAGHPTYYQLIEEAARVHAKKNRDYGGQAGDPLSNFKDAVKLGITAVDGCLVRMSDKFARICNLSRKEKQGEGAAVSDESIEDTLLDLANYALLAICLRREQA
jgi:hypothetical protein